MALSSVARPSILHVVECMGAGVATAVLEYVEHTPEADHQLLYSTRAETAALPQGWEQNFVSVRRMPEGHLKRIAAVRSFAQEISADVVHAHSSFAGAYARLAMVASSRRRIVYTAHCYAYERSDIPAAARYGIRAFEALLAINTSTFAACSPREAELSRHWFSHADVVVVPNAGSTPLPQPNEAAGTTFLASKNLRLAGSGRVGPQKGTEYFRAAVRSLRESGVAVEATWIGGGDPQETAALRKDGVTVTDWVTRSEALSTLSQQDVYLHTAAWEGFPLAILEAVHLKVPTIVRGIPAYDGVQLPVVLRDPSELASVWNRVATASGRASVLAECAAALARNTPEVQRNTLSAIYGTSAFVAEFASQDQQLTGGISQ